MKDKILIKLYKNKSIKIRKSRIREQATVFGWSEFRS